MNILVGALIGTWMTSIILLLLGKGNAGNWFVTGIITVVALLATFL